MLRQSAVFRGVAGVAFLVGWTVLVLLWAYAAEPAPPGRSGFAPRAQARPANDPPPRHRPLPKPSEPCRLEAVGEREYD